MPIPFTQYLRPDGRQTAVSIERPDDVETKAQAIIAAGYRFECEHLTTGDCSFTIFDIAREEDVAIEVCANGPPVLDAIDRLVNDFVIPAPLPPAKDRELPAV